MRILIACDKFKGSLSATEACEAVREGLKAAGTADELVLCPIADGSPGFTETMLSALHGEWHTCESVDALHNPIEARYGMLRDAAGEQEAVIEIESLLASRGIEVANRPSAITSLAGDEAALPYLLEHVKKIGAAGVIIGRTLYEGKMDLKEAIEVSKD